MKRAILSVGLFLMMAATAMAATPTAPIDVNKPTVVSKSLPDMTIHSFVGPMAHGGFSSQVVETPNGLVLFDVFQAGPEAKDLKAFIDSLGKPLQGIVLTHGGMANWVFLQKHYPNVPVFGLEHVVASMMGNPPKAAHVTPTVLAEGENTVGGVPFTMVRPLPNAAKTAELIVFPKQHAAIMYALGSAGIHMPMGNGTERNVVLKALHDNKFTWFMPKNGMPGGVEVLGVMGHYNATLDKVINTAKTPEEAKAMLVEAYPGWQGEEMLGRILPVILAIEKK